ncbi:ROK family transcriptional regulator [Conexibacter sp. SYSU D00693]|uniref:ROK family transcriptional regulator n=1 Tax=Conexibacter sp. SYSU D00693 TaxID=2812560 RepID=UPI00196B1BB2|nr:ROK family transcriptional regulator [Conexibacter sp. SYSU D00693]
MANTDGGGARSGPAAAGAGTVLRVIRDGHAVTRAALAEHTGLARSTVTQRVDALLASGLIVEAGDSASTGGRRPGRLAFNHRAGVVLAADLGATHSRLAVSDLAGTPLAEVALERDIADGPEAVLGLVHGRFGGLLADAGRAPGDVRGIGIGIPGPVAHDSGQPVNPPIMPGWDGFPIPEWFAEHFGADVPVLVDNDVNIMAAGEHWATWRDVEHLLYVKVGTGIGCGIVSDRRIHRGAEGAAGDIGHIVVTDREDVVCRCGNTGCLEAVAGGRALAQQLAAAGYDARTSRDVVRLVREGDAGAIRTVREGGRALGQVLAACVNFFNPRVIVVGGDIGEVHEHLLAGVREVVFQRSLPLATRDLRIVTSRLGDRAGVIGAAMMVVEHLLEPDAVDRALRAAATTA